MAFTVTLSPVPKDTLSWAQTSGLSFNSIMAGPDAAMVWMRASADSLNTQYSEDYGNTWSLRPRPYQSGNPRNLNDAGAPLSTSFTNGGANVWIASLGTSLFFRGYVNSWVSIASPGYTPDHLMVHYPLGGILQKNDVTNTSAIAAFVSDTPGVNNSWKVGAAYPTVAAGAEEGYGAGYLASINSFIVGGRWANCYIHSSANLQNYTIQSLPLNVVDHTLMVTSNFNHVILYGLNGRAVWTNDGSNFTQCVFDVATTNTFLYGACSGSNFALMTQAWELYYSVDGKNFQFVNKLSDSSNTTSSDKSLLGYPNWPHIMVFIPFDTATGLSNAFYMTSETMAAAGGATVWQIIGDGIIQRSAL